MANVPKWSAKAADALSKYLSKLARSVRATEDEQQEVALRVVRECDPDSPDQWQKSARRWLENARTDRRRRSARRAGKETEIVAEQSRSKSRTEGLRKRGFRLVRSRMGSFDANGKPIGEGRTVEHWWPDNPREVFGPSPFEEESVEVDTVLLYFADHVALRANIGPASTPNQRRFIRKSHAEAVLHAYEAMFQVKIEDLPWTTLGYSLEWALWQLHGEAPQREHDGYEVGPEDLRAEYEKLAGPFVPTLPDWVTDNELTEMFESSDIGRGGGRDGRKSINAIVNAALNRWRKAKGLGKIAPAAHCWSHANSSRGAP